MSLSVSWIFDELRLLTTIYRMKLNCNLLAIFFVAGLLPPIVFRLIAWQNEETLSSWPQFGAGLLSSVFITMVISCGVVTVLIRLNERFPWRKGILKRLFLEILLTYLTAFVLVTILTVLLSPLFPDNPLSVSIPRNLLLAFIFNSVLVAVTEGIFFFQQWRESTMAAERYERESLKAQLESLKSQVNPHFLFNSLNTLSGLIDQDRELSKEFIDGLSKVYRYLLQHQSEEVVSLHTELDFIHAFTMLLKKRHGERVDFHFNIHEMDLKKGIPPMTLQLLVENAVKHNIASRKRPLKVEVLTDGKTLSVKNNLQRKASLASIGIGLENIRSRYGYLTDEEVQVIERQHDFEVKVPLLKIF